jgi:hypothetical protein
MEKNTGWLLAYKEAGLINVGDNQDSQQFTQLYITSIYWVIVTFSSVGYGDITGNTPTEIAY